MRKVQGYAIITDPNAPTVEFDTITCCHCNIVVRVYPAPAPMVGGFCRMCMKYTCDACAGKGCTPFEKKLEAIESHERFLRSIE